MKNLFLSSIISLSFAACSNGWLTRNNSDSSGGGADLPVATGCLAGAVINGLTGARIDISGAGLTDNFFVLVSPDKRTADPVISSGEVASRPSLVGEYTLCGVPVESEFPIYVTLPGFQGFEGRVDIRSGDQSRSPAAEQDLPTSVPTLQASIRLFPLATATQNYTVSVSFEGAALPGALVELMPTGRHVAAQGEGFLSPAPTGFKTLSTLTDDSGAAVFNAADLALGALYKYAILPPDAGLQQSKQGELSVGYVTLTLPSDPYVFHVNLQPVNSELVIVSDSRDANHYSADGSVSFYFNRPIELVPSAADLSAATLDHQKGAVLAANVPGNDASEQVDIAISGQSLKLSPKFKTGPVAATEPALGITYSGIEVRPTEGQKLLHKLSISANVKFFGGAPEASVATTIAVQSGNNQAGNPGTMLANPVVARVSDQFGAAMAGVDVAFAVTAGGGSVSFPTATTNAQGIAQVNWTLGTTGTQTVTATAGALTPVPFTATFSTVNAIEMVSGKDQKGLITSKLTNPLVAKVTDVNNLPVVGADVVFTVDDAVNGGTVKPVSTGSANTTQTVKSDAQGQAVVEWTMGTQINAFTVHVTSGAAPAEIFTATALSGTFSKTNDAQSGAHGVALTLPITATLKDQTNAPIVGVTLQFATANAGALLKVGAGTAAATVTGVTDALGQVSVVWTLGTATGANTTTVSIPAAAGVATVNFTATGT